MYWLGSLSRQWFTDQNISWQACASGAHKAQQKHHTSPAESGAHKGQKKHHTSPAESGAHKAQKKHHTSPAESGAHKAQMKAPFSQYYNINIWMGKILLSILILIFDAQILLLILILIFVR